MRRKRQAAEEVFFCVETDAKCTSARSGRMLAEYILGELSPKQRVKFEEHLGDCIACSAAVITARNIQAALKAEENRNVNPSSVH